MGLLSEVILWLHCYFQWVYQICWGQFICYGIRRSFIIIFVIIALDNVLYKNVRQVCAPSEKNNCEQVPI